MIADITYGTFLFFGSAVVCGMTFAYFFLPETKSIALEDMEIMFSSKGFAREKRKHLDRILSQRRDVVIDGNAPKESKSDFDQVEKHEDV